MTRHEDCRKAFRATRYRLPRTPMLLLLFQIQEDWYALDAAHVVEVLPLVKFKPVLHAPPGLAGVFSYHGIPVPLIDLSALIAGTSTQAKMSTRLILVNYQAEPGVKFQMGLLVEELMETLRRTEAD